MADDIVDVKFGGDAGPAKKAIEDTRAALKSASADMSASLKSLKAPVTEFQAALAGLASVLAGGAMFKASVEAANDWNTEITKLSKAMGTTAEEASVMAVALKHIGLDADAVTSASLAMTRQLSHNEAAFQAFGVQTRDVQTGALKPIGDIMASVNQKLLAQTNVAQRNADGMRFYGRQWTEVMGILKLTTQAMEEANARAKELGLVVGQEGVQATRELKEEQRDMGLILKSVEIQIGEKLLPTLVNLGSYLVGNGAKAVSGFGTLLDWLSKGILSLVVVWQQMATAAAFGASVVKAALTGNLSEVRRLYEAYAELSDEHAAAMRKLWDDDQKAAASAEKLAQQKKKLETDLQIQLSKLEDLRVQAAKGANAEILKSDKERTDEQLKDAQRLHQALQKAFEDSVRSAKSAKDEAAKLLQSAADKAQSGADAAAATRERLLSPDDQKIVRQNREDKAGREIDEAGRMVGIASVAVYAGRNESAKKLLDTNEKILEAQKKIVDAMEDSEEKARRQESIGNHLSQIDTARARMKQGEAKTEEERTQALADKLKEVESQIKELTDAPAKIKIEADIQQAIDGINTTLVALGQLQDKTVTVTVKTVQEGQPVAASGGGSDAPPGFAEGGYTGSTGGIVHPYEQVIRADVVAQPGVRAMLETLNRGGVSALASAGMVNAPAAAPASSGSPNVFNFPGMGSFEATMAPDQQAALEVAFRRVALQKGARR